jgi:hypothetical protein
VALALIYRVLFAFIVGWIVHVFAVFLNNTQSYFPLTENMNETTATKVLNKFEWINTFSRELSPNYFYSKVIPTSLPSPYLVINNIEQTQ